MRIACCQLNPQENVELNFETARNFIVQAAKGGAEVVVLPEMFTYMGVEKRRLQTASRIEDGIFAKLAQLAKELGVCLLGGSHSELCDTSELVFNSSVTYSPSGTALNVYRKIHLFNLRDAEGNPLYCESDVFRAGDKIAPWSISEKSSGASWKCLTAICYDLRFPELFRKFSSGPSPVDVVFLPAAFTYQTGKDHWEVLLRARAIENQCYFVACNQTGFFAEGQKRNFGHSMVVDPWGNVVSKLGEEVAILFADISKEQITAARTRLPALADRRL